MEIQKLEAAIRAESWREALDLAVTEWRQTRSGTLGELILALGERLDGTQPRLSGPAAKVVKEQQKLARKPDAGQLGRILAPSPIGSWGDRHRLMELLADWPADPRLGHHAVKLGLAFRRDDLTVPSYFPWAVEVALRHADARVVKAASVRGTNFTRGELKRLSDALRPFAGLPPELERRLEALRKSLAAPAATGDEGTLLERIHADPDDDGLRVVYADALTERGDPRGEFISLQLQKKHTPAQRAQLKALLAKHERTWSGPLARALDRRVYERGFLVEGEVSIGTDELAPTAPEWATVERVRNATKLLGPQFNRLVELETNETLSGQFPRLARVEVDSLRQVAALLEGAAPKLTTLSLFSLTPQEVAKLLQTPQGKLLLHLQFRGGKELFSAYRAVVSASSLQSFDLRVEGGLKLVRTGSAWELHLSNPGSGDYRGLVSHLRGLATKDLTRVRFVGTWNRFGPGNLADALGDAPIRALIDG